jgi:hypothetical protein
LQCYLPKNLPPFKLEVTEGSYTKFIIPITISIKIKWIANQGYKNTRLLVAIMKALQMAYHDSYIASVNYAEDNQLIAHHNQVPMEQQEL